MIVGACEAWLRDYRMDGLRFDSIKDVPMSMVQVIDRQLQGVRYKKITTFTSIEFKNKLIRTGEAVTQFGAGVRSGLRLGPFHLIAGSVQGEAACSAALCRVAQLGWLACSEYWRARSTAQHDASLCAERSMAQHSMPHVADNAAPTPPHPHDCRAGTCRSAKSIIKMSKHALSPARAGVQNP